MMVVRDKEVMFLFAVLSDEGAARTRDLTPKDETNECVIAMPSIVEGNIERGVECH